VAGRDRERLVPAEGIELGSTELALLIVAASTMNTITSASLIARRAWTWTCSSIASPGAISRPPVSTTTNRRPFHSASP